MIFFVVLFPSDVRSGEGPPKYYAHLGVQICNFYISNLQHNCILHTPQSSMYYY